MSIIVEDPVTRRVFVTGLARAIDSDAWPHIAQWWQQRCATAMLAAKDAEAWARIKGASDGGVALLLAIENEVSDNRTEIDGRLTRHERARAAAGIPSTKRTRGKA